MGRTTGYSDPFRCEGLGWPAEVLPKEDLRRACDREGHSDHKRGQIEDGGLGGLGGKVRLKTSWPQDVKRH